MTGLRVLFMGTPEFALPTLRMVIDGPDDVVGVVTQPDRAAGRRRRLQPSPVKRLAQTAGLNVIQPARLANRTAFEAIASTEPDVCVVIAYGKILGPRYLALPRHGCLNIHASLLPRWRGAAPINWAVASADAQSGITIQQMDQGLDTGPIVRSWSTPIDPLETAGELHDRLAPAGAELMASVLDDLREGRPLAHVQQDDALATYARMLTKADGYIAWERPPEPLVAHIHGMTPWPGAVCRTPRGPLKILRAQPAESPTTDALPGTILAADGERGLVVAAGSGAVRILECQRPGRQAMAATDFINGLQQDIRGERWLSGGELESIE